jgi:hypothetical protein
LNAIHLANGRTRRLDVGKVAKPKTLGLPALAISHNAAIGEGITVSAGYCQTKITKLMAQQARQGKIQL